MFWVIKGARFVWKNEIKMCLEKANCWKIVCVWCVGRKSWDELSGDVTTTFPILWWIPLSIHDDATKTADIFSNNELFHNSNRSLKIYKKRKKNPIQQRTMKEKKQKNNVIGGLQIRLRLLSIYGAKSRIYWIPHGATLLGQTSKKKWTSSETLNPSCNARVKSNR